MLVQGEERWRYISQSVPMYVSWGGGGGDTDLLQLRKPKRNCTASIPSSLTLACLVRVVSLPKPNTSLLNHLAVNVYRVGLQRLVQSNCAQQHLAEQQAAAAVVEVCSEEHPWSYRSIQVGQLPVPTKCLTHTTLLGWQGKRRGTTVSVRPYSFVCTLPPA